MTALATPAQAAPVLGASISTGECAPGVVPMSSALPSQSEPVLPKRAAHYVGAIVGETPTHWIQRLSPNTAILHDKTAVAGAAVGQAGTLRYRQGRAELAPARDQDRGRSLSR